MHDKTCCTGTYFISGDAVSRDENRISNIRSYVYRMCNHKCIAVYLLESRFLHDLHTVLAMRNVFWCNNHSRTSVVHIRPFSIECPLSDCHITPKQVAKFHLIVGNITIGNGDFLLIKQLHGALLDGHLRPLYVVNYHRYFLDSFPTCNRLLPTMWDTLNIESLSKHTNTLLVRSTTAFSWPPRPIFSCFQITKCLTDPHVMTGWDPLS